MQTDLRENNCITLIGEVSSDFKFSHEVFGEKFYTFYLNTERLSKTIDSLPVTISERLIDKNILKIGALIEIKGQIRSYNNIIDKKNHLVLSVFVKDINFNLNESKNPNLVTLNGFLCKTPVYRKTPFGREITDILLAVNRSYNKSDYIPCITWGRNAKFTNNIEIGENIIITGRMQSRKYQKKLETGDIIEKVAYEVSVSKLQIVKDNEIKNELNYDELD